MVFETIMVTDFITAAGALISLSGRSNAILNYSEQAFAYELGLHSVLTITGGTCRERTWAPSSTTSHPLS